MVLHTHLLGLRDASFVSATPLGRLTVVNTPLLYTKAMVRYGVNYNVVVVAKSKTRRSRRALIVWTKQTISHQKNKHQQPYVRSTFMAAFPRHVLELTLQYLLPLNLPLPPHIISPPLLQRHHFLSIQPSDAAAYLLWPKNDGSSSDDTIGALDEIQLEDVNFEHIEALFTADADAVKAHVKLGGDLQVIFLHSPDTVGNVEWKYHDIARLPFPKKAFHNLDSAANYFAGLQNHGEEDVEEKESAAGFWDGYGS